MCAGDLKDAFELYFSTNSFLIEVISLASGSGGIMARKYF
jgi:hypothetical protein